MNSDVYLLIFSENSIQKMNSAQRLIEFVRHSDKKEKERFKDGKKGRTFERIVSVRKGANPTSKTMRPAGSPPIVTSKKTRGRDIS
jgi:hypothetical protein